jgi:uncharacterized protein
VKLALLVFAIVVLAWLLRGAGRRRVQPPSQRKHPAETPEVQAMVACSKCGVLIPGNEALQGRGGVFCCDAHRDEFEPPPPPP